MSLFEFWWDIKDYYQEEKFIDLKRLLLLYMYFSKKLVRVPSIRFWAFCIIITGCGFKIMESDGTIWTIEGLFEELEELWRKK